MITILPADKSFLDSVAAPFGTDAMVLRDAENTVEGYALFRIEGDTVEILRVEATEPLMKDGLIRAVLNTGDCRGATIGLCREESLALLLERLEFEKKTDAWVISIDRFFHEECSCGQ